MAKKPFPTRVAEPRGSYTVRRGPLRVSQDIVPAAELKAKLGDVLRGLDQRRPIVITLNGRAAAVLMSPAEFDRLTYEQYVRDAIKEGLADLAEGRVYDGEEMFDEVLAELDARSARPVNARKKT